MTAMKFQVLLRPSVGTLEVNTPQSVMSQGTKAVAVYAYKKIEKDVQFAVDHSSLKFEYCLLHRNLRVENGVEFI